MNSISAELFAVYFSPYTAHAIECGGIIYSTVEHAYHCQRYIDRNIINEILTARSPFMAWKISQQYKSQQIDNFNDKKREVMKELYRAKLHQHEDVRQTLIGTGDKNIVKHITSGPKPDGFWDDGIDGTGRNESGKIWMELRDELVKQ